MPIKREVFEPMQNFRMSASLAGDYSGACVCFRTRLSIITLTQVAYSKLYEMRLVAPKARYLRLR